MDKKISREELQKFATIRKAINISNLKTTDIDKLSEVCDFYNKKNVEKFINDLIKKGILRREKSCYVLTDSAKKEKKSFDALGYL